MDAGTDRIRAATFTGADVHDTVEFKKLVRGDEEAAYADKGYPSAERRAFLAGKGIEAGIMYKAARNKPLQDRVLPSTLLPIVALAGKGGRLSRMDTCAGCAQRGMNALLAMGVFFF